MLSWRAVPRDRRHGGLVGERQPALPLEHVQAGIPGVVAEKALESCGIIVNKNKIPGDTLPAQITSGIRLGTNTLALRGLGPDHMGCCATLINQVLQAVTLTGQTTYTLNPKVAARTREEVAQLCVRHPLPYYPIPTADCGK